MRAERYGRHWRVVMPDGRSLFDAVTGYPRIWSRKRDAVAFIEANPNVQQPTWPEVRKLINWGATVNQELTRTRKLAYGATH